MVFFDPGTGCFNGAIFGSIFRSGIETKNGGYR